MKKQIIMVLMASAAYAEPLSVINFVESSEPSFYRVDSIIDSDFITPCAPAETKKISSFTVSKVLDLAIASDLAYKNKKNQAPNLEDYGFTHIHSLRDDNNSWFVGDNSAYIGTRANGEIVISFTGTTGFRNIATDVWSNWAFDHENGGCYHNGILIAFRSLQIQMMTILNQIATESDISLKDILAKASITGHSLGGGMALIAADILRRQDLEVAEVVTFAAPRVMDMVTATEYNNQMRDKTLIVKQFTDPIPVISPFMLGSKQVGQQLVLPYHLPTWQHCLGGYIAALRVLEIQNGSIDLMQFTWGGLRNAKATWNFEHDKTKDQRIPIFVKSVISETFRVSHRIALDTVEGINHVYTNAPLITSAATFMATNAWNALTYTAQTIKSSAQWSYKASIDTQRTSEQKVIEALQNTAEVTSHMIQSTIEVAKEAVIKSTPTLVNITKWIGSKIWTRTKDFANDVRILVG